MKRCFFILLTSVVFIYLAGCRQSGDNLIRSQKYIDRDISISYPVLEKYDNSINNMIKAEAMRGLDYYDAEDYIDLNLEVDYEIKYLDYNFISVVFSGMGYVRETAHPNNLFYTINIDLSKKEKIRLKDITEIDSEFIHKVEISAQQQLSPEYFSSFQNYDKEKLKEYLKNSDLLELGSENQYDVFSYVGENIIGISLPVGHVAGDHIEIEVEN